ncbi:keratin-associated protein 9-1 isoform X2 [Aethina tumida]|uniref:keratin-associated protein 9-1 isoform X2 n=1 Tax=Aethina tumida TaxID=116153 RepID=UPI0021481635|nr:keratin-associated protein 9-1 isoform X2 [Aethina tumida]
MACGHGFKIEATKNCFDCQTSNDSVPCAKKSPKKVRISKIRPSIRKEGFTNCKSSTTFCKSVACCADSKSSNSCSNLTEPKRLPWPLPRETANFYNRNHARPNVFDNCCTRYDKDCSCNELVDCCPMKCKKIPKRPILLEVPCDLPIYPDQGCYPNTSAIAPDCCSCCGAQLCPVTVCREACCQTKCPPKPCPPPRGCCPSKPTCKPRKCKSPNTSKVCPAIDACCQCCPPTPCRTERATSCRQIETCSCKPEPCCHEQPEPRCCCVSGNFPAQHKLCTVPAAELKPDPKPCPPRTCHESLCEPCGLMTPDEVRLKMECLARQNAIVQERDCRKDRNKGCGPPACCCSSCIDRCPCGPCCKCKPCLYSVPRCIRCKQKVQFVDIDGMPKFVFG